MNGRKLRVLVVCLLLVFPLVVVAANAGEVVMTWDASPGALGYKVYYGTAPGQYIQAAGEGIDVDDVVQTSINTLPDGCIQLYGAVSAYNIFGESDYSDEVSFYPRAVLVGEPTLNPDKTLMLLGGGNFGPGLVVKLEGAVVPSIRSSCELVTVPVAAVPTVTQGSPVVMDLCNDVDTDGSNGNTVCLTKVLLPATKPGNVGVE